MQTRTTGVISIVLFLVGCAATTPPPRFSAFGPADADAPEAATPPPAPTLATAAGVQGTGTPGDPRHAGGSPPAEPVVSHGHEGHVAPTPSTASQGEYSCPMHPEVRRALPGGCPRCGMQLVLRTNGRQ